MISKILLTLAIVATLYLITHIPAAMYLRYKNPEAVISIGWPVIVVPIILWLAALVSHYLKS